MVCNWFDNRSVYTGSNWIGIEPIDMCRRFDRTAKKYVEVARPACVKVYNALMGGVDKADMLLSLHRTRIKTKKWYLRLIFHLIDMALVNAWLLCKASGGSSTLQDFKLDIARCLMARSHGSAPQSAQGSSSHNGAPAPPTLRSPSQGNASQNTPSRRPAHSPAQTNTPSPKPVQVLPQDEAEDPDEPPPKKGRLFAKHVHNAVRYDGTNHWPIPIPNTTNSQRCKFPGCKGKTFVQCEKCYPAMYLCLQPKTESCFRRFHVK